MKQTQRVIAYLLVLTTVLGVTLSAGTYAAAPAKAAAGAWSSATPITTVERASIFPELAVDSSGVVHMIFEETSTDLQQNYSLKYSNNRSGSFAPPVVISGSAIKFQRSAIAVSTVGSQTRVDVIYAGSTTGPLLDTRIYHTFSLDGGTTWSTPQNISDTLPGFVPQLHIDALGHLHVVFSAYIGSTTDSLLAIFYTTNAGSGWSAPAKIAERQQNNSYNSFPTINSTFVDNVVTLHVMFMGQILGSGEYGKWVYSMRKVGAGDWTAAQVRGTTGANFPTIATNGAVVYAAWQGVTQDQGTNTEIYYSVSTDNGLNWSQPVQRSNGTDPQSNRPKLARAQDNSLMLVWEDVFQAQDGNGDIWYAYAPDAATWSTAAPVYQASGFSYEVALAASCENYHAMWHDSSAGNVFRIFFSQTGPTTSDLCTPPPPPVDFTASTPNTTPTTNPNITVQISDVVGDPDQMRYSLTPFTAANTAIPWVAFATSFNLTVPNTPNICAYTVYIQLQSTATSKTSAVKTVTAAVDRAVQASATLRSLEQLSRPASAQLNNASQPNAPAAGNPAFTRFSTIFYSIGQEGSSCSGTKSHSVEGYGATAASYPTSGYVPLRPFDENADSSGVGFNEQRLTPTAVITDQLNNVKTITTTLFYDDDPPVLAQGGVITSSSGTSTNIALIDIVFSVSVTDESYSDFVGQPNAGYWGAWVLASNSATPPTPAQFEQYGDIRELTPGTKTIKGVALVNLLNAQMRQAGPRFVHVHFLDGAGNYTEDVLTSPQITLEAGFSYPKLRLPLILK